MPSAASNLQSPFQRVSAYVLTMKQYHSEGWREAWREEDAHLWRTCCRVHGTRSRVHYCIHFINCHGRPPPQKKNQVHRVYGTLGTFCAFQDLQIYFIGMSLL